MFLLIQRVQGRSCVGRTPLALVEISYRKELLLAAFGGDV